ncbi:MAG: hypothetical protein R6X33_14720 [Candidatus Brocadiia bacterium]
MGAESIHAEEKNGSGVTCRFHTAHEATLHDHERRLDRLEELVERIMARPPVWVTAVISILTALLGVAGTMAARFIAGGA